nr:immunoglobulin heavy chain junction region [Macaca mulatta]
CWAASDRFDVW